jgi:hypothetical protein
LTAGFFVLLAMALPAQVQLGDLRMSMNGTVAPGYSATSSNQPGSAAHSFTFGGASTLTGSYHSPNFFSFNSNLYLNQSRANSGFQSISNSSGIDLTTTIFGGSEFPGSVGYSLAYNSDGNYGIPGVANIVTHGNSDSFSVGWSENVQDLPNLSATFQMGGGKYSVYGSNESGSSAFHSLNLHSSYRLAGFGMGAYYAMGGGHSLVPGVIAGESSATTDSTNDSYGFNVSHRLPLSGSITGDFNRTSFSTGFEGSSSSGTIDLLTAQASLHPFETVSFSAGVNYSDNLSGQLVESVLNSGGVAPGVDLSQSSNSLDLDAVASYAPTVSFQTSLTAERRTQTYLGQTYGVTSYGAGATYSHTWRLGSFNSSVNAIDNSDDQNGNNSLGFDLTESYTGEFKGWKVNGNFSYAQNVQTLLVTYMNSFYNYSVNAHRRMGKLNIGGGAAAGRTALSDQPGTENDSQSYNAIIGYGPWITTTATYARAQGQALATGAGLIPVPIPTPVLPSDLLELYGGNSYGFSASSSPVDKLTFSASYSKSLSNTAGGGIASQNENSEYNALVQYQMRKLGFTSGYARLEQGFSTSGIPPQIVVSYYAGVSRWFNFF